jgi:hypothetical protein
LLFLCDSLFIRGFLFTDGSIQRCGFRFDHGSLRGHGFLYVNGKNSLQNHAADRSKAALLLPGFFKAAALSG